MNGYMGSLLFVDLGRGETRVEALDPVHARRYLGGNGLAAKIIYDLCPPDIGALDEGNCIVFATGPLNGTPVWGCGRGHMAGISPQTGLFFDSNFGGDFASMLKGSGFDAVVICGKASSPVYLSIDEGDVHICDASAMWGKNTSDAHEMAIWEKGKGVQTAMIGPAGENLITYACIIMSGRRKSAAGRGGLGAVLGSKMLKGLVVRGSMRPQVADQQGLKAHLKSRIKGLREKGEDLTRYGTPVLVEKVNDMGKLGTRNNTREIFGKASLIGARYIHERYVQRNIGCRGCPLACGKEVRVPHGAFAGHTEKMPEYETLYAMGSMLENSDVVSIFNANTMCDEMGLDSISFGVTLAFVAECVEKGIINKGYLEREICFGDMAMLSDLVKMAAVKKGHIGEMLAMGSQALSQELGRDSSRLLYTSKGLEIPGHSARAIDTMGLAYATATRGGSHHDARPLYSDAPMAMDAQVDYCIESQNNTVIGDCLVMCRFIQERALGTALNDAYIPLIRYVTGWDMDIEELDLIAQRVYNLERWINCSRGAGRNKDSLPWRVMNEPVIDGPSKGKFCPPERLTDLLDRYYRKRGWDTKGIPLPETLKRLGIIEDSNYSGSRLERE